MTITTINRLIVACNDGARAHAAAARVVNGSERRDELDDGANRRRTFAAELSELVRGSGGTPSAGGSTMEELRAAAHWVRALLIGENSGDSYGTCERVEAHAERLYVAAMGGELSGPTRLVVSRHHVEIAADRALLRRRSMGG